MVAIVQITLLALLAESRAAVREFYDAAMAHGGREDGAHFAVVGARRLGTLALVGREAKPRVRRPVLPLFVVIVTGGVLVYGTLDMPPFGDPADPAHHHVAPRYIEESPHEIGVPNLVTAVLASYRGYDTMGETTVIFTALIGVLLLIGTGPTPRQLVWWEKPEDAATPEDDPEEPHG